MENNHNNKFLIDPNSGEVKLNGSLDFETTNAYSLKVIATDSKGATKDRSFVFNVADVAVPDRSLLVQNQNLIGNRAQLSEPSDNQRRIYIPDDLSNKDSSGRVLLDLNQGNLPEGSTYSISSEDASKYEVDSSGLVRIKPGTILNDHISENRSGDALINYLAGFKEPGNDYDHALFEDIANFNVNIPNEPIQNVDLKIVTKKVESQENVVMKFASGYSSVSHNLNNAFKASAIRGDGTSKTYNSSVQSGGTTITESTLSSAQLDGNTKIKSGTLKVDGSPSDYASSEGISAYRTNTVANGLNENDTNILDFEYLFPINDQSGASITGSVNTKGQYAPLSVTNADWDNFMNANEKAKYGCYDSGQGCGNDNYEQTLSGSIQRSIEGVDYGYYVKDWNLDMNEGGLANGNYLLNADPSGGNAGSGTGIDTLIHSSASLSGVTHSMQGGEAEYYTVLLPESFTYFGKTFTHLHINENGFISFDNDASQPYNNENLNILSSGANRGAFPLSYFDQDKHFINGLGDANSQLDDSPIPEQWGRPGVL